MRRLKVMTVFGTRPEGIKMAPIVKVMENTKEIENIVCVTAQHREMLDQVLDIFEIKPDYDLNIFKPGQTLTGITTKALEGLEKVIVETQPDLLLVQGDTTTVFAGALAAFYQKVKVGHVEAGLRSGNLYSPYPEEANRKLTGIVTNFHFAPTNESRENLLREGYPEEKIFITGNTVIDALFHVVKEDYIFEDSLLNNIDFKNKRVILLTSHRRENIGKPMENIFTAIDEITRKYEDVEVIFPVHLNPKVRNIAHKVFDGNKDIHLVEPLDYEPFTNLMSKCHIVVTDSGGLQEEAPSLGKPVLVVREETERPEGIEAGTAKLVGTSKENISKELDLLLSSKEEYKKMANAVNPYGDGKASERIVKVIIEQMRKSM
ncbi:UDP-N-acetylglucosamine 2-epimerase (non-hydrolyzing) [Anaerosalibacter bizertensis]|uniref:UDP-N-acetylglucosamine 2-epimerase (non-hydrolyzing) n=1 Tax=Anaerosalibacter bizertensis TaxID=932217 RepID=A0A9Q4AEI9_9FIRM|nr:UDP-N-acetylglucosamine 2-epimerase (non-hydrolyzing) [Anaerosalibacter bizertensis]MCB5560322.1 UDP-N-acetylglucosamine 2-epimerase (non-hydrolyzing) [Anaerosalibacter bizertensis]MCG4565967.1 UDP-N-acetylglucosamine 2-epimerase (non-hydrolyzing) [Anaerosalibacter bizertensis]MCG4583339.1 UDP-N-acetylglucosamine 2-epimerase (non-hydrolyzing) [Anaerosalibacter bizertensis]MCG4585206.1 UDP-N-acetylglucosamine 2-epimerase (non-hydrolyzing) [Anaerosalibacter bizertensis]